MTSSAKSEKPIMQVLRSPILVALTFFTACGFLGGPEGHYAIDRKLSSAAIDRYAEQQLTEVVAQVRGANAKVSDTALQQMKEASHSIIDQMVIDFNLDSGGKFRGSSTIEKSTDTSEGTWILHGDTLELTETSQNGKPLAKPKTELFHYDHGRLTFEDAKNSLPFLILSKQ
jgi:hypothetical protein